jgi:ankyrin repeat protein
VLLTHECPRFLLACLHVDSLIDEITKAKIKSALNDLSKGSGALDDAYREAIVRIDGQPKGRRILAKNVLLWVSYAQRPLTTGELCHALAVELGDEELDPENIPDIYDILPACAGLVTVDEKSQVIRLVHYTAQIYLENIREKWHPGARRAIASTCLTYLCFKSFSSGSCRSDAEFESRLKEYKFLDYSAQYWHQHAATVQEEISELAMVLLQDSNRVACALQTTSTSPFPHRGYSQFFPKQVTGLHLAVSFGLLHLSKELLSWVERENVILVDAKDGDSRTPLIWAAQNGHKDTVELLLDTGKADVDTADNDGWTPLMLAANNGHKDTVKLLLGTGQVNAYAKNNNGWTPLELAAQNGHKDTLELLLNTCKADIGAKVDDVWALLMLAAQDGHKDIVELLLSIDKVNLEAMSDDGWTPLMLAAQDGHKDTVELLLGTGKFDPNATDDDGITPLILAARDGHKDIVKLLLDTGKVDADAKSKNRWTPLMLAALGGHEDTVELLLGTGKVDIDAINNEGWTPLMLATRNGHRDTVEVLRSYIDRT